MPLDPAQRHQIEQDAVTAAWEAERLAASIEAIALLREIADLDRDDVGDVILGADANGHNALMSRITAFLVDMKYSTPIGKILERELARLGGKPHDRPTRVVGEIQRIKTAVEGLEAVISNRNPADTDAVHVKKAHDARARLAKAAEATKTRANDLLSTHSQRISAALAERTGLRPAETLEGGQRGKPLTQKAKASN
jgi:hypothetical protein